MSGTDRQKIFPKKILLATDGSMDAEPALRTAVDLAKSTGCELHVVTVGQSYSIGQPYKTHYKTYYAKAVEARRQATQDVLNEQVWKIEQAGGSVETANLRIGEHPDQEIVNLSEEISADLILIGRRELARIRQLLIGSVSDSVIRQARCPVMVVPSRSL